MLPKESKWYWLSGIAVSIIGVVVARVAPAFFTFISGRYFYFIGMAIAFFGLFIITVGTSKRHKNR